MPPKSKTAIDLAAKFTGDEKKVMSTIAITGKEQVMLRVRVAEVQRTVLKQFGINWQAMFDVGKFAFNLVQINPFSGGTALLSPGGYAGSYQNGSTQCRCRAARHGARRPVEDTLAEPTLTAISGETANFLAGGEFPIPVSQGNDGAISVEFKKFGVGLGFTPVVLSEGRISLSISHGSERDRSRNNRDAYLAGHQRNDGCSRRSRSGAPRPQSNCRVAARRCWRA